MIDNLTKIGIFLLLALLSFSEMSAQQHFNDKKRADYIINASQQIKWPDSVLTNNFTIAVLGKEDSILYYLKKIQKEKDSIHKLPLKLISLKNTKNLSSINVLYLHKRSGFNVDDIYEQIKGKNILLIGENFEFQSTMIGLVEVNNRRRFTVNKDILDKEGFKVPSLFMALAIKTRDQMVKEYQKSLKVLKDEQTKVIAHRREIRKQKAVIDSQATEINLQIEQLKALKTNIKEQEILLAQRLAELEEQEQRISKQKNVLAKQIEEIDKQENEIVLQKAELSSLLQKMKLQRIILFLSIFFIILAISLIFFIYRGYRIKKESNKKLQEKNDAIELQNAEIMQQSEEIHTQRDQLEEQRDILAEQRQEILDSIQYAKRIQEAVLTPEEVLDKILPEHFIIYHPRNIVSGDYYWGTERGDEMIIVAADCTGHGVPGAFMSMLGVSFLNEIVNRMPDSKADDILNELRALVIKSLHQTGNVMEQKDGMDLQLCIINKKKGTVQFAGANNPLYILREKNSERQFPEGPLYRKEEIKHENGREFELFQVKADKMPIGIYIYLKPFTLHELKIYPGDQLVMFSDGYVDQFGGKNGRKYMTRRFKENLLSIADKNMSEQKAFLEKTLSEWMQGWEQVDDILVMGLKI